MNLPEVTRGTTSLIISVPAADATTPLNSGKTGLVFNTSGLVCNYMRERDTVSHSVTLQTMTLGTWATGGFKEADATNLPGSYDFGVPNAAIDSSPDASRWVKFTFRGVTGVVFPDITIPLVAINVQDAVRGGMTALPNADNNTVGGLPILDGNLSVAANLKYILGALLTETVAGYLSAAFKKLLDVATPVLTVASLNQTGDNYARLGNPAGASVSVDVATLLSRLSALRATYMDNMNVGGLLASSSEVTSIQNNTRAVRVVPIVIERPDSGSVAYRVELLLYDEVGNMEAPDSTPTISVVNQSGTSRDANLDSTTMTLVSAGRYRSTYTVDTAAVIEQLVFSFVVIEGGATRQYGNTAQVVDTTASSLLIPPTADEIADAVIELMGLEKDLSKLLLLGEPLEYETIGGHESETLGSGVFTVDLSNRASGVIIQASVHDVYYTVSGEDPTSTNGFVLVSGQSPIHIPLASRTVLKFLRSASGAILEYQQIQSDASPRL